MSTLPMGAPANDPILTKFLKALQDLYGPRLERVVLFGSRAHGDAVADSDYDLAVFLHDLTDRRAEVERLTVLQDEVMAASDPYIDAIPFPAGAWAEHSPFMHELRPQPREREHRARKPGRAQFVHARAATGGARSVKSETKKHLDKAERCLTNGRAELAAAASRPELADDAARNAYVAAFHAAKALIFERTGRRRMKHGTVHKLFDQLSKAESSITADVRRFLSNAYDFKRVVDYDIDDNAPITLADASRAIAEADRFLAAVRAAIP